MKKIFLSLLIISFVFTGTVSANSITLPEPGILPGHPFYFLKILSEGVGTLFALGIAAKADRFLYLSEKRLAEALELAESNMPEDAEKAIKRYQKNIEKAEAKAREARERGLSADEVFEKVSTAMLQHQEVLAIVYKKVPDEAREAVTRAINASIVGHEEALKAISGENEDEVRTRIEEERVEKEQTFIQLRREGIPIPKTPTRWEVEFSIKEENNRNQRENFRR
ncbi:hypothetical protein IIB50_00400 [Patescibacteria group bacterium]|nr:hypothetical protein [Patescibacteria group bacterium]